MVFKLVVFNVIHLSTLKVVIDTLFVVSYLTPNKQLRQYWLIKMLLHDAKYQISLPFFFFKDENVMEIYCDVLKKKCHISLTAE